MEQTKKIVQTWESVKEQVNGGNIGEYTRNLAEKISEGNSAFREDLVKAYYFVLNKFGNETRKDGRTPLVLHSLFLTEILYSFGEKDSDAYLTAILHDTVEDTKTSWSELEQLTFATQSQPIANYVRYLTENKTLSKNSEEGKLSERVKSFIQQLKKAPTAVINTEIADRLHDLSDMAYLSSLPAEKRTAELERKAMKCKNIVYQIIQDRNDYNTKAADVFFTRINEIETELGEKIAIQSIEHGGV